MKVNQTTTKVILFNNAVKYDCQPNLSIQNGSQLETWNQVVRGPGQDWLKLEFQHLSDVQSCISKVMDVKDVKTSRLLDVYDKQIRWMLEFSTLVWTSGLTQAEGTQIERVQKAAFSIILDEKYKSYAKALTYLNRVTLSTRRSKLNLNFSKKCLKSDTYQHWFKLNKPTEQISKIRSVCCVSWPLKIWWSLSRP